MSSQQTKKTVVKLSLLAVTMFGFGYALVPIYDVFCEITGLNGKTGELSMEAAAATSVDKSRVISVGFDTNVHSLPWEFKPLQSKVKVHPGKIGEAHFTLENKSSRAIVGRAVPSVAPTQASVYFNKTECFCFTEQTLAPGEKLDIVVRFVVDPRMPRRFSAVTLSYTYFDVTEKVANKENVFEKTNI